MYWNTDSAGSGKCKHPHQPRVRSCIIIEVMIREYFMSCTTCMFFNEPELSDSEVHVCSIISKSKRDNDKSFFG